MTSSDATTPQAEPEAPATAQYQTAWPPEMAGSVPTLVNSFLSQFSGGGGLPGGGPSEIILSFGYTSPPVIVGTPEQQRSQAEAQINAGVVLYTVPLARLALTRDRLFELQTIVNAAVERWEQLIEEDRAAQQ